MTGFARPPITLTLPQRVGRLWRVAEAEAGIFHLPAFLAREVSLVGIQLATVMIILCTVTFDLPAGDGKAHAKLTEFASEQAN